MNESLTMAQIAGELGVSRNAVSAVINNRARQLGLAVTTEQRIRSYLEQRGYVQSHSAVTLRRTVGVNPIGLIYCGDFLRFPHLIRALALLTTPLRQEAGYVDVTGVDPDQFCEALKSQVGKGTRRLIWIHANPPATELANAGRLFPLLERMERVVICNYDFGRPWDDEYLRRGIDLVGYDRGASYHEAAELFRRSDRRSVGLSELYHGAPGGLPGTELQPDIFTAHGLTVRGLFTPAATEEEKVERMAANLIRLHREEGLDCAFVRNDYYAAGVIAALLRAGLRVPEDLAVVGFGNLPLSEYCQVPLTTFDHPVEELCRRTLELIRHPRRERGECYRFHNRLIERNSH